MSANTAPTSSRREFLRAVSLAGTALWAGAGCGSPTAQSPGIIDTHTHFYDPNKPGGVAWPPKGDNILDRPILPEEFTRLSAPLGVSGTVVVEASPRLEDNDWVLELAAKHPNLLGLVGFLKPGQPGFAADLKRLGTNPRFRGLRVGGWGLKVTPDRPEYVRDLALLADRDLALDVLAGPDELPQVARLAGRLPDLRMILNHCGNVRVDGSAPPARWVEGVRDCAKHPRVFMKVSGLVEGTGKSDGHAPTEVEFYRPTLDVIWENFGEDRLLFGSNWPVCSRFASYATVLGVVRDYFSAKGRRPERKYLEANARSFYRWPRT